MTWHHGVSVEANRRKEMAQGINLPIMSEEMQAQAEASAKELLNRIERNIAPGSVDGLENSMFYASIAISLRRIADSLDVIANAK
jgi:hypothetical protein